MNTCMENIIQRRCVKRCKPEGKELLKKRGIEGDYEGVGHCIL